MLAGVSLLAAFLVVSGVVLTDRAVDLGQKSWIGPMMFMLGWGGIAALSAFQASSESEATATSAWPAPTFVAVGVMLIAMGAQGIMLKSRDMRSHGASLLAFFLAWCGYAVALSFRTGSFEPVRFGFGIFAAVVIPVAMVALAKDRRFDMKVGKPVPTRGHAFGMGLPMLTIGWISVVLGISYF